VSARRTKRERIRDVIELPYIRLPLVVTVLLLIALALIYLIALMASVYALAVLFGVPTVQLVIGIFSATGTLASASVGYLLYRNSVKGAEITVALEDPLEVEAKLRIRRNLAAPSQLPAGATQELFEILLFRFEVVLINSGPRSGTMTNIDLKLVSPSSSMVTMREGAPQGIPSEDRISLRWEGQVVTRETFRPTALRSGQMNAVSLGSNESLVLVVGIDLLLSDQQTEVRPPFNTWLGIQQRTPYFEFELQWKTASKGKLKTDARSFRVRPKVGPPIIEGPAAVVQ
jgi:hypothetical protein